MALSTGTAGRRVRVKADAKSNALNVPAKLRGFGMLIDPPHNSGYSEDFSHVNEAGILDSEEILGDFASDRNLPDMRTEQPLDELAIRTKSGRIARAAPDITDRKRMEQNLSTALDYNRLVVDVCPVGVTVFKATGECVSANEAAAEIVGATIEQIRRQNFRQLQSWKDSGLLPIAEHAIATRSAIEDNFHINPSTFGKTFWISTRIIPFVYKSEQYILALYTDITEKKRIEELNAVHVEKLAAALMQTVEVITALSAMRDPYTAGHERRVAEIAVAIGAEMGFDAHRQQGLRVAGHLHDVGKINVPAEILSKPGKLSAAEFALVKDHARAGYDALKNVEFPWPVALVALQLNWTPSEGPRVVGFKV